MKKLFLAISLTIAWQLNAQCISSFNNRFKREFDPTHIFSYCECIKEQKIHWIAKSFQNKDEILRKKDLCALSHFDRYEINFFYNIKVNQYLLPYIYTAIESYYLKNIQMMPGWLEQKNCIHQNVSKTCSKVKSLETSYHCIKKAIQKNYVCETKELKI